MATGTQGRCKADSLTGMAGLRAGLCEGERYHFGSLMGQCSSGEFTFHRVFQASPSSSLLRHVHTYMLICSETYICSLPVCLHQYKISVPSSAHCYLYHQGYLVSKVFGIKSTMNAVNKPPHLYHLIPLSSHTWVTLVTAFIVVGVGW